MEISAHPVAFEKGDLVVASFYDKEKLYGVTLSRMLGSPDIELMVADQSCYVFDKGRIELTRGQFNLMLPTGTIDHIDGEDNYLVKLNGCTESEYLALKSCLGEILNGFESIEFICT